MTAVAHGGELRPSHFDVPEVLIADLRRRLAAPRRPDKQTVHIEKRRLISVQRARGGGRSGTTRLA